MEGEDQIEGVPRLGDRIDVPQRLLDAFRKRDAIQDERL
jgi:hypothetical protein